MEEWASISDAAAPKYLQKLVLRYKPGMEANVSRFIYRWGKTWEKRNPTEEYPANIAEVIIAKHRNGRTGSVKLYFQDKFVKFENLAVYQQNPVTA